MMASKKGQVTTELSTDKEWKEFVKRPGLLVIDLFSDWAGPCVAMNTPLKTLKTSEMAFEWMHLAFAPTSIAPALKRFDGTSRPTFVLLSGGRLVNVIFGCNAPRVIESIKSEIEREINASKGLEKRKTVSLTQLSPAEQDMQAARLAAEGDTLLAEQTRQAMEADRVLRTILTQIAENLPDTTLVVVFPHALQADQCDGVLKSLRETWTEMGFTVAREEHAELTKEAVDLMFWERRLPQHDALVESVTQGASLVLMLERSSEEDDEEDQEESTVGPEVIVARSVYGFLPGTGSSMEFISPLKEEPEDKNQDVAHPPEQQQQVSEETTPDDDDDNDVATPAPAKTELEQGEEEDEEEEECEEESAGQVEAELRDVADQQEEEEADGGGEEEKADEEGGEEEDSLIEVLRELDDAGPHSPMRLWNPRELLPALDSAAARLLQRKDESGPALPGLWTPLTALTKAAAVKALFPNTAEQLYTPPTPPPPPPPPLSVVFFSGDKREEVLEVASNFPTEVTRYGFFTKSRKLLASARPDYEKLVRGGLQVAKTLLVLEVTRVRSAPLLELSSAGPQYVSATPAIAKNDVEDFFGSRCTPATAEDVREITKIMEQVPDEHTVVEAEAAGSQRPSAAPEGGELPVESQPSSATDAEPVQPVQPAPVLPMPEAGEGSIAPALDEMQGAVLDVGEGDAPVTGGEGDTITLLD